MGGRKIIKQKLMKFKEKVCEEIDVRKMILFGSRARGKVGKDVDFDIMVVSPNFKELDFFQRGAKMYDYWDLNYPVDFLCYAPDEFEEMKNRPTIVNLAVKEGMEI